jgi:hypothetical protein
MWVSHIMEYPGLTLTGRPGIKMSYLDGPSLAGHYLIFDHHMMICFVTNPGGNSYAGQERRFAAELQRSLQTLRQLLDQHAASGARDHAATAAEGSAGGR